MADARPFRGLRFDPARVDAALTIAPPYDVISPDEQRALYERSPHNIVRIEYGMERPGDDASENRYARAARDLRAWLDEGVLVRDARPALYAYVQEFTWDGRPYSREAWFCAMRLEPWERGVVKPHEHTLAKPKEDRLRLLRATRTQVSPVYSLFRPGASFPYGEPLLDVTADGQRHVLGAVTDAAAIEEFAGIIAEAEVYIADGHHRYETALAYRDEVRAAATSWSGDEPENFVLMALTAVDDPGLLVLPTHRVVLRPSPADAVARVARSFDAVDVTDRGVGAALEEAGRARDATAFVALGLEPGRAHLLRLRDRVAVEALMPAEQPASWKRLDVNVLQYGVLQPAFGIDDAALTEGGAVTYTQDAAEAERTVASGAAQAAFLLNATPVEQVLAVADAGGRMPQKSTFFHPKLPTGLVMNLLDR
jgi:uncharacterized protein (DUF1015 family)